jgi:hypothetical protein
MYDTKIAIIVRDHLAPWQELNVTAFLTSGIVGANRELLGEPYEDAAGNTYNPLIIQPDDCAQRERRNDEDDLSEGDGTRRATLALHRGDVYHEQ